MSSIKLVQEDVLKKLKDGEIAPEKAVEQFQRESSVRMKYVPQRPEELRTRYMGDRAIRQRAIKEAVPFVHRNFSQHYMLVQGLILIGALSGKSKSTTGANIVSAFLEASDRRAMVINNEELAGDAYDRISCIQLKQNFDRYRQGKLPSGVIEEIRDQSHLLMSRVEVIAGDSRYEMTCLEHVISVLEYAAEAEDVGLILLDYLQTVSYSEEHPEWDTYKVSKALGDFLRDYGRRATVPVVVLAQLKPKSESADMQSRIQNDKTIYSHAFSVIEIIPDFETMQTTFAIHKDRFFGQAGKEVLMQYESGRYESLEGDL